MQLFANTQKIRDDIIDLMIQHEISNDEFVEMLDYTIDLFESRGLGREYYGYHNINHELEVTYCTLLGTAQETVEIKNDDIKYLYAAALFHDFDPEKSVDKPHEENVLKFIESDKKLSQLIKDAGLDIEIIKVLILRTTYPWAGELKENAEEKIQIGRAHV